MCYQLKKCGLVNRGIERRKEMGLIQKELAKISFVSSSSIKRFKIILDVSFRLLIGRDLNCSNDFYVFFIKEIVLDIRR